MATQVKWSREQENTRLRHSGSTDITSGQSLSDAYVSNYAGNVAIQVPTIDSASLTFQVQAGPGEDFVELYADTGSVVSIAVATGGKGMVVQNLAGWYAFKIRTGTVASPVAQTADREIEVVVWDD